PIPTPAEAGMADTVLAQLTALKAAPIAALKQKWRDLFETEPPPYNRRFLEHRLAYRIQELAYGGLKPEIPESGHGSQRDGCRLCATRQHSRELAAQRILAAGSRQL